MSQPLPQPPPMSDIPWDPIDRMRVWRPLNRLPMKGRRIFVRSDLNLPMNGSEIADASRAEAAAATIKEVINGGGVAVVASHLGRPAGKPNMSLSLKPIAVWLQKALGKEVTFCPQGGGGEAEKTILAAPMGSVVVLENLRFDKGEEAADQAYAARLALGCDAYVGDAFSVAHRNHASVAVLPTLLPPYAGRLMEKEVAALEKALDEPDRPAVGICGGKKVADKLETLVYFVRRMDYLLVGGAMANTMLALCGENVGGSIYEHDARQLVLRIIRTALAADCEIILPEDGIVATSPTAKSRAAVLKQIGQDEQIFDIGPKTVTLYKKYINKAKTVLWNGPVGFFEQKPFATATDALAAHIATRTKGGECVSVAGGGDTAAALVGKGKGFTHISLAGGAFLSWFGDAPLPGVQALRRWPPDGGYFK